MQLRRLLAKHEHAGGARHGKFANVGWGERLTFQCLTQATVLLRCPSSSSSRARRTVSASRGEGNRRARVIEACPTALSRAGASHSPGSTLRWLLVIGWGGRDERQTNTGVRCDRCVVSSVSKIQIRLCVPQHHDSHEVLSSCPKSSIETPFWYKTKLSMYRTAPIPNSHTRLYFYLEISPISTTLLFVKTNRGL